MVPGRCVQRLLVDKPAGALAWLVEKCHHHRHHSFYSGKGQVAWYLDLCSYRAGPGDSLWMGISSPVLLPASSLASTGL